MKKTERISINVFDKIVKSTYEPTAIFSWNGIEVVVKKTLSFAEMMAFVDGVAKNCFAESDGAYLPEVKDFIIKSFVLEMYTNLSLPENTEHRYHLIYCSDIIQTVLIDVNKPQFNEMVQAINDKIDNRAQANIEMVHKQMNELYVAFDKLQSQLAETFSGVGVEDISNLTEAISNGRLDEDKLVRAYINRAKDGDK